MVLNGEEGLECEVHVNWVHLEHVFEFKFLGCVYYKVGTDGTECSRKVASGRRVAGAKYCSLNVLESCMKHCLFLFLYMAVRQCYGKRRDLELGVYTWTNSEDC